MEWIKKIKNFVSENQTKIIIVGTALASVAAVATSIAVGHKLKLSTTSISKNSRAFTCGEFGVSAHVRNLPTGFVHSAFNESKAAAAGINLAQNQSYIASFLKNI